MKPTVYAPFLSLVAVVVCDSAYSPSGTLVRVRQDAVDSPQAATLSKLTVRPSSASPSSSVSSQER